MTGRNDPCPCGSGKKFKQCHGGAVQSPATEALDPSSLPPPNLQGNYRGACIVCLKGTDTGLTFRGRAEWIYAGLHVLGIPEDQVGATLASAWRERGMDVPDDEVPRGEITETFRVCGECVSKTPFPEPALLIPGGPIPLIEEPAGRYPHTALD
jgi:hypothetical protein